MSASDGEVDAAGATAGDTAPDAATVEALRAANDELRRRNEELEGEQHTRRSWGARGRTLLVAVLVAMAAICATAMVPAIWGRNLVLNNDRYVQTLAPLASDPGVQNAVIAAVNAQFADKVDIASLAKDVLPPAAAPLAGPLQAAAQSLVNTVITRFVQSDAFQTLWEDLNRLAHEQLVAVLTGRNTSDTAVSIVNDRVVLNLGPVIDQVKQQLVDAGLTVAANVPSVGATITIAEVHGVDSARAWVRLLDRLANWLPVIAALFLVAAIVVAHNRRKTVIAAMLSLAAGMLILGLALAIGRTVYLNQLPGTYFDPQTQGNIYDTLVRFLRLGLRIVLASALFIALIAWLVGPGAGPRKLRSAVRSGYVSVRDSSATGNVLRAARGHQLAVYATIAALGAIVLVLWTNPSSAVVISVIVIVLVLVGLAALLLGVRPGKGGLATAGAPSDAAGAGSSADKADSEL